MKTTVIQGCKDCPYKVFSKWSENTWCGKDVSIEWDNYNNIPETPHPNCKLDDLPTIKDAVKEAENSSVNVQLTNVAKLGIEFGANYVLNKINGS